MNLFIISGWVRCSGFCRRWARMVFWDSKNTNRLFFSHIGNGLENLLMAVDNVGGLETLSDLAT